MPWLQRSASSGVDARLWVASCVLDEMEAAAAKHAPAETGGMLIGYRSANGEEVVTGIIDGGARGIREKSRFVPDGRWQQQRLDEIYLRSRRHITYLGDWHSHPHGVLSPSRLDRKTARRVAKEAAARTPQPLAVIGVSEGNGWRWAAFRYYRRRRSFRQIDLERFERQPSELAPLT